MCFLMKSGYLQITVIRNSDSAGMRYFISLLQLAALGSRIELQRISKSGLN
jgi:hypothetical protein